MTFDIKALLKKELEQNLYGKKSNTQHVGLKGR